jgi:hypothetical protein
MYQQGQGVDVDFHEALNWFRGAAEDGNDSAMFNLGRAYEDGTGVLVARDQAVLWYRKAAAAGNAEARLRLQRLEVLK